MKLCIVTNRVPPRYGGSYGGGAMRGVRYAQLLSERGHDVSVVTKTSNPDAIPGIRVFSVPLPDWPREVAGKVGSRLYDPFYMIQLARVLTGEQFDVVHCIGAGLRMLQVTVVCRLLGYPVALEVTLDGSNDPVTLRELHYGRIRLALLRLADRIISISPTLEQRCREAAIPPESTRLIPNSVNREEFSPVARQTKHELKKTLGVGEFEHILISVGVLRPRKNQEQVLEIFRSVAVDYPQTGLVLAGPTDKDDEAREYAAYLRSKVEELGLSDRVLFPGYLESVEQWLQASDVFLFASHREGLPSAPLEAMSVGLPCLVHTIPGTTDFIIDDGIDGFIYNELEEAVYTLRTLLEDEDLRQAVGARAAETVEQRFTDSAIMQQYEDLYQALAHSGIS